jgi:hypothetical protein
MDPGPKPMGAAPDSPLRRSRFPGVIPVDSGAAVVNESGGLGCAAFKVQTLPEVRNRERT